MEFRNSLKSLTSHKCYFFASESFFFKMTTRTVLNLRHKQHFTIEKK